MSESVCTRCRGEGALRDADGKLGADCPKCATQTAGLCECQNCTAWFHDDGIGSLRCPECGSKNVTVPGEWDD